MRVGSSAVTLRVVTSGVRHRSYLYAGLSVMAQQVQPVVRAEYVMYFGLFALDSRLQALRVRLLLELDNESR